jgi:two-component system, OmpR family, alkaline phosphatase synthesis response regulator PhoP
MPGPQLRASNSESVPQTGRILIADDNTQNRELLEAYLADDGHEILMAADGRQTVDVATEKQPDLVLLDIMMPKLSGYEVCEKLKADPRTKNIPILMVTALRDMADIEKAVAAGADDFLSKPVHRIELKTRVKSLLRVRHLTSERDRLLAYLAEVERSEAK